MLRIRPVASTLVLVLVAICFGATMVSAQLADPASHPKFVNPLPIPTRIDATKPQWGYGGWGGRCGTPKTQAYSVRMGETTQWLGLVDVNGAPLNTTVWGYGLDGQPVTYPGPTFLTRKDVAIDVLWKNELPNYNFPDHLLPVDMSLHMAHTAGGVPTVVHLHGGHTESASDGLPEQWFTQGFAEKGPQWVKETFHYDNDQEAATLWYHDHVLGITRLNVYAGLAGFYLLRDFREDLLEAFRFIPRDPYDIEIVIQDRDFDANGGLFMPFTDPDIEPGFEDLPAGPSAIAEFFGHYILVNGMTWPKMNVEPRKYRLRYLNGSDSRFYVLEFQDAAGVAQPFVQIATDDGFLERAVPLTRVLLAPGERVELVVDFRGLTEVVVRNFGPDAPFKGFNPDGTIADGMGGVEPAADPASTGLVMKFAVNQSYNRRIPDAFVRAGTPLRGPIAPLQQTGATRQLALFEGRDAYGRLQPLLGTLAQGSLAWFEPITENPMLNDVEVWEVYNSTEDAHPIHLHMVSFQIINRESFVGTVDDKAQPQHDGLIGRGGSLTVNSLLGDVTPPAANESGWKDTAVMLPGQVTRVIAKFDREGRYVWHCHILSHEDHEMMRPFQVGPIPAAASSLVMGPMESTSAPSAKDVTLDQNYPNPFNPTTQIRFTLPADGMVDLRIYNVRGQEVRRLANDRFPVGSHVLTWDGKDASGRGVASGVYFYKLVSGSTSLIKKMVMVQ